MFFDKIYGRSHTGFAALMTVRSETGKLDSERFFKWPVEREHFERIAAMRHGEDVYYTVALFSTPKRSSKDKEAVTKIVWADADICMPENFRIPPSIIVQTSPPHTKEESCGPRDRTGRECNGHWHVMWELDDYYPADKVQYVARKIAYAHKHQGCDTGWTMTKILRIPGTSNTKFDPPFKIPPPEYNDVVYTLDQVEDAYQDIEDVGPRAAQIAEMPELLPVADLEHYVEKAGLTDLYLNSPQEGQSWSERAYRFQLDLFRYGLTPQEVFSLAENAACNKYNPIFAGSLTQSGVVIPERGDPHGVLWREVQKIHTEFQTETAPGSREAVLPSVQLLDAEELELIEDNPTFIDRYAAWVKSRHPDVDPKYPVATAWLLMSNAYGNLCYVDSLYGKMFPNLWLMIGGQSTVGHKSAAKSRLLEVTHALEAQTVSKIDIGSDSTAEKLTTVLGDRDKLVSLLHTDEINGFFKEATDKRYRAGTLERYTELYDGSVPVVLRASEHSGNAKRAKTVFNFLGVGIYRHIVRTLTRENFESGFMIRALWTIGDEKTYQKGDSDFANNPDNINYGDPVFRGIVAEMESKMSRSDMEKPIPMRIEEDALERLNQWTHKLKRHCLAVGDEVLGAGVDRLRDSVVKAAALLSFHNEQDSIPLFEMLVALRQGEQWFKDLERIVGDVSNTSFGRILDDVEQFIALGPNRQRTDAAIYKKFGFRPSEFKDVTESLRLQGRARRVSKEPKWEVLE